jgi:Tat protein translocase TatB subunit
MFGTLGGPELFLIFVVALIVFGPRKLPEIGKSLGKMMAEFRKASNDFRNTIESEVEAEKIRDSMRIEPPKVEPVASLPPETHASTHETPKGAELAAGAAAPKVEPVPEAVSRETTPSGAERQ